MRMNPVTVKAHGVSHVLRTHYWRAVVLGLLSWIGIEAHLARAAAEDARAVAATNRVELLRAIAVHDENACERR